MLLIGEFSKICGVSTKTLRYYEEIGLIVPNEINPENGYRYYSIKQGTPMTIYHSPEYNPAGNDTEFAIPIKEVVKATIWEDKRIISKAWFDRSTAMTSNNYGYLWWLREEDGIFAYLALGDGGNVIYCIPQKDMVVAITSEFAINPADRIRLIMNCIVPAAID